MNYTLSSESHREVSLFTIEQISFKKNDHH